MNKMLFGYNFGKLSIAIIPQAQAKADREDWVEIDPATLTEEAAAAYVQYKEFYRKAKAYREAFEQIMRDAAGISTVKAASPSAAKGKLSMSDLMAMNGRRR